MSRANVWFKKKSFYGDLNEQAQINGDFQFYLVKYIHLDSPRDRWTLDHSGLDMSSCLGYGAIMGKTGVTW